jgi:hypothetical protein
MSFIGFAKFGKPDKSLLSIEFMSFIGFGKFAKPDKSLLSMVCELFKGQKAIRKKKTAIRRVKFFFLVSFVFVLEKTNENEF